MTLHPAQIEIASNNSRFRVVVAGRRFGKTVLVLTEILKWAGRGGLVWYVAPTYKQAKMIAWRKFIQLIPPGIIRRKNETELFIELKNGGLIELKGADNEDTLRGGGLNFLVLDETAHIKSYVYDEILDPMTIDHQAPVMFIGTPSLGKNWFWKLYLKGKAHEKDWSSFHFTTFDNPYLPKEEEVRMRKKPPRIFKQECLAQPQGIMGLVHPEFSHEQHVVKDFKIPLHWQRVQGADWGIANPTCVLWGAVDPESYDIYVYRCHYQSGWTVRQHASHIKNASKFEKFVFQVIDPSAFKTERDLSSVGREFQKEGVNFRPANNAVEYGINVVNKYLTESPRLFIFESCVAVTAEMEEYMYEPVRGDVHNVQEQPKKKGDHAMNALRYMLVEVERCIRRPTKPMSEQERRNIIDEDIRNSQRLAVNRRKRVGIVTDSQTGYLI